MADSLEDKTSDFNEGISFDGSSKSSNDSMNKKRGSGRYVPSRYLQPRVNPYIKDAKNTNKLTVKKNIQRLDKRPLSSMASSISDTSRASHAKILTPSSSIISLATSPIKKEFAGFLDSKASKNLLMIKTPKDMLTLKPKLESKHLRPGLMTSNMRLTENKKYQVQIPTKSKKVSGKLELTKQQMNEVVYSSYLQYVYLDALAEKTSHINEIHAIEQISKMRELTLKTRLEKRDLKEDYSQSQNRSILKSLTNIIDNSLLPIVPKLPQVLESHSCIISNLDVARDSMIITGIHLPPDDDNMMKLYYDELLIELQESESLIKRIIKSTTNTLSAVGDSSGILKEVVDASKRGIKEMERCGSLLGKATKYTLEESFLKQTVLNNDI